MRRIDPRTSRMLSERSTIWAASPQWFRFELAYQHNSWKIGFRFVTSCQFLPIISKKNQNCRILKNVLGMRVIDPRTSRMLSERSTIWDTSPYSSSFEVACEQNSWSISFPFVTSCQFIPIISKYKPELSNPLKCFGDAGHWSPYLSHAKRALYHLSYIPVLFKFRASFWTKFMKYQFSICNELSIHCHYQQIQTRIVQSSKMFWRCGALIPVPLACKASALPFEIHPRPLQPWS